MGPRFPTEAGKRRAGLVVCGFIALAIVSFALARPNYPRTWPLDFGAFYCAGSVVAKHHDPYRTEPLRTCENEARGFSQGHGFQFAVPAPLPGYSLAPFVLLSRLPYRVAIFAWIAILLASFASTVLVLRQLCGWRVETIFAALLLQAMLALFLGQIVPVACAAMVAAAFLVSRGRDRTAALAAALSMFEPHLGIPVCLALLIARPRSRAVLAVSATVLAAISIAVMGIAWNIEYIRDVLPAHALSEISNDQQYSLTFLAHLAGLGEHAASTLGTLSYIVMLGLGVVGGRLAAARTGKPTLLLLVPPAFAVFGGPFVHVTQLAIAIPAALVLSSSRIRGRPYFAMALFLLAVPWEALKYLSLNVPVVAGVTLLLATDLFKSSPLRAGLVSAGAAGLLVALFGTLTGMPSVAFGPVDPRDGGALAEIGWRSAVDANFRSGFIQYMVAKVPGWCGLLLIIIATLRLAASRPSGSQSATEPSASTSRPELTSA